VGDATVQDECIGDANDNAPPDSSMMASGGSATFLLICQSIVAAGDFDQSVPDLDRSSGFARTAISGRFARR
jgi:hypothetical protein